MHRAGASTEPRWSAMPAIAVLLLTCAAAASALDPSVAVTQYVAQTWTHADGLIVPTVFALAQTPDGYIWAGTPEGLERFDGTRFTVFTPGNSEGLSSGYITALAAAADGTLWIGTVNGLSRLRDGVFRTYTTADGLAHDVVLALEQGADGSLWIGTNGGGLSRLTDGQFRTLTVADGLSSNIVNQLALGEDGRLFIGTPSGVDLLVDVVLAAYSVEARLLRRRTASRSSARGPLFFATQDGLSVLDGDALRPVALLQGATCALRDSDGSIWAATRNHGVHRLTGGRSSVYLPEELQGGGEIFDLLEDREGSLWVATDRSLVRLASPRVIPFGPPEGQLVGQPLSVSHAPGDMLWIGGAGGLTSFKDGGFHFIQARGQLSDELVTAVLQDSRGAVWIGTPRGVDLMRDGRITRGFLRGQAATPFVISLCEDRAGSVWVGTRGQGLYRVAGEDVKLFTVRDGLTDGNIGALLPSRDGTLWVGGTGGLNRLDPETGRIQRYTTREGLAANYVLALHEDARGTLWVGSWGGLTRVRGSSLVAVTPRHGLPNGVILQILEDDAAQLWLSSPQGIFSAAVADLERLADRGLVRIRWVELGEMDGMRSRQCSGTSQPAGCRTSTGKLWFPTADGAVLVDPRRVAPSKAFTPVVIESITVDGRSYAPAGPVVAPPGRRKLDVTFSVPSFRNPTRVLCRYRLEGFEKGWTEVGSRRSAYYTNLPKGTLVFRVAACNEDGEWDPMGTAVAVTLKPYFHETWWFLLLCGASVAIAVGGGVHWRVRRLKAHRRELQALVAERTAQLEAANRELERLANEDGLTRIPNVRHFRDCLVSEWRRTIRNRKPISLLLMDVDHFKRFNDRYGHPAGDECLRRVAGVLKERMRRAGDMAARYGGEEFIVLLANADDAGARVVAGELRSAVEALGIPHEGSDVARVVTISIGCATTLPGEDEDPAELIAAADQALYRSKQEGRNRCTSVHLGTAGREGELQT